jgi:L-lactate dehydrogenase complex protein LldG
VGARDEVLGRVHATLGPESQAPPGRRDDGTDAALAADAVVERFVEHLDDHRASVHRTNSVELPSILADIIDARGHRRVVVPPALDDTWLIALYDRMQICSDIARHSTRELQTFDAVITAAAAAIADSGTIVLDHGGDQGRAELTLVPDHHLCVVRVDQIVQTEPEALDRLDPTRTLTFISGPSASPDPDPGRGEGQHGSRALDVINDPLPFGRHEQHGSRALGVINDPLPFGRLEQHGSRTLEVIVLDEG